MSASLNQADLPAREFMCVNDASVWQMPDSNHNHPGSHTGVSGCSYWCVGLLILVYRAAVLLSPAVPFRWLLVLYVGVFRLKNANYALHVHVRLCSTGPLTRQEYDLICFQCECWDVGQEELQKRSKIRVPTFMEVLQMSIFRQILCQFYHEVTDHYCCINTKPSLTDVVMNPSVVFFFLKRPCSLSSTATIRK